jgi:hypothetical protein
LGHFSTVGYISIIFDKNGLGSISGDFLKSASGHPDRNAEMRNCNPLIGNIWRGFFKKKTEQLNESNKKALFAHCLAIYIARFPGEFIYPTL